MWVRFPSPAPIPVPTRNTQGIVGTRRRPIVQVFSGCWDIPRRNVSRPYCLPLIPPNAVVRLLVVNVHVRHRDTSGAARTNSLAAASSSIHRPMASYETGDQEFRAPFQFAEATGRSSLPREFRPPRTRVQRSDENAPLPSASTTACCSRAPRPVVPGIHMKKRMIRLAGCPGSEVSNVLIMTMRSTPAANIDSSTAAMFVESKAERSWVVAVTPIAVRTASAPANASMRAGRLSRDSTTTTRDPSGRSAMRSGRERTMAVKFIPAARHTPRIP